MRLLFFAPQKGGGIGGKGKAGRDTCRFPRKTNYAGRSLPLLIRMEEVAVSTPECASARMHQNRSQKFFLWIGPGVRSGHPLDPWHCYISPRSLLGSAPYFPIPRSNTGYREPEHRFPKTGTRVDSVLYCPSCTALGLILSHLISLGNILVRAYTAIFPEIRKLL